MTRMSLAEFEATVERMNRAQAKGAFKTNETPPRLQGGGMVEFRVAGEPFPWQRTDQNRANGARYTPPDMAAHQRVVKTCGELAGLMPRKGAFRLEVMCYRQIPVTWSKARTLAAARGEIRPTSVPDASNYLKEIEDALIGVAYRDDAQVVEAVASKHYCRLGEEPYTLVRITPLSS